jgi:dihydroorotase
MSYDLVLHGGTVWTPGGEARCDVAVRDGKIVDLGTFDPGLADRAINARGLHVLPGVIDSQVHFREPGMEHKEDLQTGTAGAALGGVTAIFEMPNTNPNTTTQASIEDKLTRAAGRTWVDHAFYVGASAENVDALPHLERLPGVCGVKIFMGSSTGTLLVADDDVLEAVLRSGTRRCAVHSEDDARLTERRSMTKGTGDPSLHPEWRDVETAVRSTKRLLRLARKAGRRVHVLHISTADELPLLQANKDLATVEFTPQHLTLAAPDCYERLGTLAQMNPPIRTAEHRAGLWEALRRGLADVIGSDHAPHTLEEKGRPYPGSPSGMPGVQTLLPLMLDHVAEGRLTLRRLVELTSAGPQRVFGIAGKGRIAVGYDADFTVVDLGAKRTIERSWMATRSGWSPFEGQEIRGWPIATIVRGHLVMKDDELLGDPVGAPVRFVETMPADG